MRNVAGDDASRHQSPDKRGLTTAPVKSREVEAGTRKPRSANPISVLAAFLCFALAGALHAQTAKITVSPKTAAVEVGKTKQLSRTVTVVWASSDTTIATVSQTGLVTARKPGTASITVSAGSPLIAVSTITVLPPAVASITITFAAPFLYPGQSTKVYATLRDAQGNVLTGRKVTWSTSNASVLRVSPTVLALASAWPGR